MEVRFSGSQLPKYFYNREDKGKCLEVNSTEKFKGQPTLSEKGFFMCEMGIISNSQKD